MTILVLCWESNLCNTLGFYAQALRRRGVRLVCVGPEFPWNGDLDEWLRLCPERPSLIWHPEADVPFLPWGLATVDIPTACFQVDTYAYTRRRISWSMLFDLVLVFHPGYDVMFREGGHPGAHFMPHAVEADFFSGPELERLYEVGWVGQTDGPVYRARTRVLAELSKTFRMNEVASRYSTAELTSIYRQSKIVVNIGRDKLSARCECTYVRGDGGWSPADHSFTDRIIGHRISGWCALRWVSQRNGNYRHRANIPCGRSRAAEDRGGGARIGPARTHVRPANRGIPIAHRGRAGKTLCAGADLDPGTRAPGVSGVFCG